jgi:hypothetical protein
VTRDDVNNNNNNNNCSYSRYTPCFFFFLSLLVSTQIIPRISTCYFALFRCLRLHTNI